MDFFQHQAVARKKTALLVCYFSVAVTLIVAAVYLAVAGVLVMVEDQPGERALWDPLLFVPVTLGTALVIVGGSLYKMGQLRGGGKTVARMLGGRPVLPNTRDLDERVLLNVVEEMAIAAGMSVPPVYLLEEEGINAFAAGFTPADAVIGVTRGAIEKLTRDELQGVIAHEFSHVMNGDMRLNIRLIGVLHGILLIALIGYSVLRALRHVRGSRSKKGGGAILVLLLLGAAFVAIGYIGVLFGKLIKGAVSRQREFLADASAVQFTRNPDGITGALKKIGGSVAGSRVKDESAEEASHLFFGNALWTGSLGLMSSHPPLRERIRRIDPGFDGKYQHGERVRKSARDLQREDRANTLEQRAAAPRSSTSGQVAIDSSAVAFAFEPAAAVASVGTLDPDRVAQAALLIESLPEPVRDAVHEPLGAVATVYCLLLDAGADTRGRQLETLAARAEDGVRLEVERLLPSVDRVGREARLPLAEMAIPALCQMTEAQYREFGAVVVHLVEADERVKLFERALQRMLLRHLAPHFEKPARRRAVALYTTLDPLFPECARLLSILAHAGHRDAAPAAHAFARGVAGLGLGAGALSLIPREQCGLKRLDPSLARLTAASPELKKRLLEAAAACIDSDGRVTVEEAELLRLFADSLDCPMPPLSGERDA